MLNHKGQNICARFRSIKRSPHEKKHICQVIKRSLKPPTPIPWVPWVVLSSNWCNVLKLGILPAKPCHIVISISFICTNTLNGFKERLSETALLSQFQTPFHSFLQWKVILCSYMKSLNIFTLQCGQMACGTNQLLSNKPQPLVTELESCWKLKVCFY